MKPPEGPPSIKGEGSWHLHYGGGHPNSPCPFYWPLRTPGIDRTPKYWPWGIDPHPSGLTNVRGCPPPFNGRLIVKFKGLGKIYDPKYTWWRDTVDYLWQEGGGGGWGKIKRRTCESWRLGNKRVVELVPQDSFLEVRLYLEFYRVGCRVCPQWQVWFLHSFSIF